MEGSWWLRLLPRPIGNRLAVEFAIAGAWDTASGQDRRRERTTDVPSPLAAGHHGSSLRPIESRRETKGPPACSGTPRATLAEPHRPIESRRSHLIARILPPGRSLVKQFFQDPLIYLIL